MEANQDLLSLIGAGWQPEIAGLKMLGQKRVLAVCSRIKERLDAAPQALTPTKAPTNGFATPRKRSGAEPSSSAGAHKSPTAGKLMDDYWHVRAVDKASREKSKLRREAAQVRECNTSRLPTSSTLPLRHGGAGECEGKGRGGG